MIPSFLRFSTFVLAATPLLAQGTGSYFNVESPQRKPITVVRIANHDYIVACNTPDNCIEIYDTHGSNPFLLRVQTGAEPISVVYNATQTPPKLYTCNYLGDSVSVIALASSGPPSTLTATLERTTFVGDEPNHIAFAPDNASLFVTLGSKNAVSQRSTADLSLAGGGDIQLLDHRNPNNATKALKDPCVTLLRSIEVSPGTFHNVLFVLANRGGKVFNDPLEDPKPDFDFDLWAFDIPNLTFTALGQLGTNNFSMAFSQTGDLWVVGTDAQFQLRGEATVRDLPTSGFVQSKLYKISGAGTSSSTFSIPRDLNLNPAGLPVQKVRALSQPTDLALYEPNGVLSKIFIAAFNSDLVGMLPVTAGAMNGAITVITIPLAANSTNPRSGPRGLAVKYANTGVGGDPGDRIYVLNRLDNAISVINPSNNSVVNTFALQRDPTPQYIRTGRKFLYSAKLSGKGFVSCASCHIDGRSDWLSWDLSANPPYEGDPVPFPKDPTGVYNSLNDGVVLFPQNPASATENWPPNKDFLITQTLQGMVNYEVNSETQPEAQGYFSNEPLHWRADRATFLDFKGAFTNLMGLLPSDIQNQPTDNDMKAFARFVFSIAYPPNPEQPEDRKHSGDLGDPVNRNDGTGGKRGLKLFHILAVTTDNCGGRSCVQCHWLPEGSNNKISLFVEDAFHEDYVHPGSGNGVNRQPMETPGIRFLRQKETEIIGGQADSKKAGLFGLLSQGSVRSINDFVAGSFAGSIIDDDDGVPPDPPESPDLIKFIRELDTGVGPLSGQSYSINLINKTYQQTNDRLTLFEDQAQQANSGLAVQARITGQSRGFWFDPATVPPSYHEEPSGTSFSRTALLALVTQSADLLVAHATPLGSERRVAWPGSGVPTPLPGPAPANITLEPAAPSSAFELVPQLTRNWIPTELGGDFNWTGDNLDFPLPQAPTPAFLKLVRIFQWELATKAPEFGLLDYRHEAPRRFRVAMDNGRHGAKLFLRMGTDSANPPPNSTQFLTFELPIYATNEVNLDERTIWETAVEADALTLYTLMLGGPAAPRVKVTLGTPFNVPDEPPTPLPPNLDFDPLGWNKFEVLVKNENGAQVSGGWQAIKIQ